MPATAAALIVPPSTAPAVPVPPEIDSATVLVALVTVLPPASMIATVTAGAMAVSEFADDGFVTNCTAAGAPAATVKPALVTPVSPALVTTSV